MPKNDCISLKEMFNSSYIYREYVMAATIITSKFLDLLRIIGYSEHYDPQLMRMADDLYQEALAYKGSTVMAASTDSSFSTSALLYAGSMYDRYDKTLVSASINQKIEVWNQKMQKAIWMQQRMPSNRILFTPFIHTTAKDELTELTNGQIVEELLDYADEIEAWLDLYFVDEYDDYANDGKFIDAIRIMESLKFISEQIEESSGD